MNWEERFKQRVIQRGPDDCWQWSGAKTAAGYGLIWTIGKLEYAHRVALRLQGVDVAGVVVRHRCDNPECTNPAHLLTGTHADNALDRDVRGRLARAKLTAADVREIRSSTDAASALAARYSITPANIWYIKTLKTWRHV